METASMEVESIVRERYRQGAQERVADLCCPVDYDPRYLAAIPQEVLERDYGCGDPSRHLRPGETVLVASQAPASRRLASRQRGHRSAFPRRSLPLPLEDPRNL